MNKRTNNVASDTVSKMDPISGGPSKLPSLPNLISLHEHVTALNVLKSKRALTPEQYDAAIKLIGMAANIYLLTLERAIHTVLQALQAAQPHKEMVNEDVKTS